MKIFSLIQLYFVLATLVGLVLIIIGSVTVVRIGLDKVVGVKPYPEFTAPYPPGFDKGQFADEGVTESQKAALASWEQEYSQWQTEYKEYNKEDQQFKREITQAVSMLLVGIPVFLIHSPRVFKKQE